jgi:transposase, IS5 family
VPVKRPQTTLASTGFEKYTKTTRRAQFLAEMERVVPWRALCTRIEPVYPKAGNGRPPVGVERMLGMYVLQHWFTLSDPAVEEALYDSPTLRAFVGIDLGQEPVPDETTVCKFRHRLEEHGLSRVLFDEVTQHLRAQGLAISTGTIKERRVWGDSAYAGRAGMLSICAPHARDFIHRRTASRATNRWKSRIRVRGSIRLE